MPTIFLITGFGYFGYMSNSDYYGKITGEVFASYQEVSPKLKKVTRIGVISDTHIRKLKDIPAKLLDTIKSFDLIVHLGDIVSMEFVEFLKSTNKFTGIAGNHDPQSIKRILPKTDIIEVNGKRLGLLHGYWFPFFCDRRSIARFKDENVDAILYGHTHIIRNQVKDGILWFNPGSAQALFPAPWKTFGVLEVGETVNGEIMNFDKNMIAPVTNPVDRLISRNKLISMVCGETRIPDYSLE